MRIVRSLFLLAALLTEVVGADAKTECIHDDLQRCMDLHLKDDSSADREKYMRCAEAVFSICENAQVQEKAQVQENAQDQISESIASDDSQVNSTNRARTPNLNTGNCDAVYSQVVDGLIATGRAQGQAPTADEEKSLRDYFGSFCDCIHSKLRDAYPSEDVSADIEKIETVWMKERLLPGMLAGASDPTDYEIQKFSAKLNRPETYTVYTVSFAQCFMEQPQ